MKESNCSVKLKNDLKYSCYAEKNIEELLVRIVEIIYSTKYYGNEYFEWAIKEEEKVGFTDIRKLLNIYYDNLNTIDKFSDYLNMLEKE